MFAYSEIHVAVCLRLFATLLWSQFVCDILGPKPAVNQTEKRKGGELKKKTVLAHEARKNQRLAHHKRLFLSVGGAWA